MLKRLVTFEIKRLGVDDKLFIGSGYSFKEALVAAIANMSAEYELSPEATEALNQRVEQASTTDEVEAEVAESCVHQSSNGGAKHACDECLERSELCVWAAVSVRGE